MKRKSLEMSKPIPVQLDLPLRRRIEALSEKMGEAKSTIMRMSMRIGLSALEKAFEAKPADVLKLVSSLDSSKESSSSKSHSSPAGEDPAAGKKTRAA